MPFESPLTPPTDNLYKFIAIGGFLLLVLSLFYADQWDRRNTEAKINEEYSRNLGSQQIFDISKACNALLDQSKILIGQYNSLPLDANQKQKINDQLVEIENEHQVQMHQFYKILADWSKDDEMEVASNIENEKVQRFAVGGIILGMIMTGAGFYLWYVKVQKYQDLVLRNEAGHSRRKA